MPSVVIHSKPKSCIACPSKDIRFATSISTSGDTYVCGGCQLLMVVQEEDEEEELMGPNLLAASFHVCPHCGELGEIQEAGGLEWCDFCGLDPSKTQDANDLSHLWNKGSWLQRAMENELAIFRPNRESGQFLRKHCGPHCSSAVNCEQTLANFRVCLKEWKEDGEESETDMGRGRKRRKGKNKPHKVKNPFSNEPHRAKLVCAGGGWFEKNVYGNQDPKSSGDTGG